VDDEERPCVFWSSFRSHSSRPRSANQNNCFCNFYRVFEVISLLQNFETKRVLSTQERKMRDQLPDEVSLRVFNCLSARELAEVSLVSRSWLHLTRDEAVVRPHILFLFSIYNLNK
jgi:hypothetical protein